METASVVFEHKFDKPMLDQIETLRTVRLNLAEKMLQNVENTAFELSARGIVKDAVAPDELRYELQSQIANLRSRLKHPDVVYADEINLFSDLLDSEEEYED